MHLHLKAVSLLQCMFVYYIPRMTQLLITPR
jgi:hypothetical protein